MPDPSHSHRPPRQGSLLAVSAAAVLAVYSAGWLRTREAAAAIASNDTGRQRSRTALASTREQPTATTASGPDRATAQANASPRGSNGPATAAQPTLPIPDTVAVVGSAPVAPTGTAVIAPANPPVPAAAEPPVAVPTAVPVAPPVPPAAPVSPASDSASGPLHDGTFIGWGTSRHGDIEATVVIEGGKITAASISRCLTRYSCSWIAHLQGQVVTRQSPDVDNVSGATQSADAFYFAVVEALKKAR